MYLLPLDQRVAWHGTAVAAARQVLYNGLCTAIEEHGVPAGVIVDGPAGASLARDAALRGFTTVCAVGAAGVGCDAAYWKVVLHYNPDGHDGEDGRHLARWRRLVAERVPKRRTGLMCDLVIPPTRPQIARGIRAFDRELLPDLTQRAVAGLLAAGIQPDVWIIEGLERPADYARVVAAAGGPTPGRWLVRAAGHRDETTLALMTVGLAVPGIAGVVLPRAVFWEPAAAWMSGRLTRGAAVAEVAQRFRQWVGRLEPASRRQSFRQVC